MIVTPIPVAPTLLIARQIQKVIASPGAGQFPYQYEDGSVEYFSAALAPVPNPTDWVIYPRDQVGTKESAIGFGNIGLGTMSNPKVINAQVLTNTVFNQTYQPI